MENTVIFLVFVTIFALLVANRASKLNRNPWVWGIIAWLVSPLLVWIALEISGKKAMKPVEDPVEGTVEEKVEVIKEDTVGQLAPEN